MAFASTLGSLQAAEAIPTIAALLYHTKNEKARLELALALARIVGHERNFVRLLRNIREDIGTPASQVIFKLGRRLSDHRHDYPELDTILTECTGAFAREEIKDGAALLSQLIDLLPEDFCSDNQCDILQECGKRLEEFGQEHIEYLILALHTLEVAANNGSH